MGWLYVNNRVTWISGHIIPHCPLAIPTVPSSREELGVTQYNAAQRLEVGKSSNFYLDQG